MQVPIYTRECGFHVYHALDLLSGFLVNNLARRVDLLVLQIILEVLCVCVCVYPETLQDTPLSILSFIPITLSLSRLQNSIWYKILNLLKKFNRMHP